MSESTKAVFLSYASQDSEAAKRICEALRQAGVEVWFDQNELVGGDAWDQKIRKQIKECALFVPIISPATNARAEGYFRLEWKLAVDRSHLMADDQPFLFPIVIGDVNDATARVPDKFRDVQWTRLRLDETPGELAGRVTRLLREEQGAGGMEQEAGRPTTEDKAGEKVERKQRKRDSRPAWVRNAWSVMALAFAVYFLFGKIWRKASPDEDRAPPAAVMPAKQEAKPSEARQLVAKARQELERLDGTQEDLKLAEDYLEQALAKDATDAEVWAALTQVHTLYRIRGWDLSDKRREEARIAHQRAQRLDPKSFEVRLSWYPVFNLSPRELREGEAVLRSLRAERPTDQRVLRKLATTLQWLGQGDEANALRDESASLPGGDPLALYDKARYLWNSDRPLEAEAALQASLKQRPFSSSLLLNMWFTMDLHGDLDGAKAILDEIPAAALQDDRGSYFAFMLHYLRREPDAAVARLRAMPRDWIEDNWYRGPKGNLTGDALHLAGRPEAAALEWRAALKLVEARLAADPSDHSLLFNRAVLLGRLGEREEGIRVYRLLEQMAVNWGKMSVTAADKAVALVILGRSSEALQIMAGEMQGPRRRVLFPAADLRLNPHWDPLRRDPEFARLLAMTEADEQTGGRQGPMATIDAKSVAVLAFANLSDDKANEYFSDGISEELLNVLAKIPGLKVTARTSSFFFKGKEVPIPEIARQLGVAFVIEGSVRKAGDKVRITAQMIKAADGFHVWSDTFTRDLKDVFAVQDEIAGLIARELKLTLVPDGGGPRAVDPVALELYLRGRQAWALRTPETLAEAEQLMQQAIARQPELARAHVGLAEVWLIQAESGTMLQFGNRNAPAWDRIATQLTEAAKLEPDFAAYHAARGSLANLRWDFVEADRHFRRALELNPNHASALQWYARFLAQQGRMGEALQRIDAAMVADPFAPRIVSNAAMLYVMAGRSQQGLEFAERALAMPGSKGQAFTWKCEALLALGRNDELAALLRHDLATAPPESRSIAAIYLAQAGFTDEARRNYQSLEAQDFYYGIRGKLTFGRTGEAVALLDAERAYQAACEWMAYLPPFDRIRAEPRFQEMLARLGLTEADARAQTWRAAHPPGKSVEAL